MKPVLELQKIHKEFPGIVANDQIDLTLNRGEVHTILGEKWGWKIDADEHYQWTYAPDSGSIFLEGKPLYIKNPAQAIAHGVGMVHQHFMLIPNHTVSENIILGTPQAFRLQKSKVRQQINELGTRYGLVLNPDLRVQDLSVGEQQKLKSSRFYLGSQNFDSRRAHCRIDSPRIRSALQNPSPNEKRWTLHSFYLTQDEGGYQTIRSNHCTAPWEG